ncbi:MAG: DDE-type integrase/transposase/recombinase [Deltaproteobacteria bacterium]|nr:DDE-type integrase/transposase/recombinase [Deltaproteobacteria bacterium]
MPRRKSDRGSQYASDAHQRALEPAGMVQSMSNNGNCRDNAVADSFFTTIMQELINRCFWTNKTAVFLICFSF